MHHVIELKRSHRFGSNSGIGQLSRAIIENDVSCLTEMMQQSTLTDVGFDLQTQTQVLEKMIEYYRAYISEPDINKALESFNRFRLLCAVREGERGVYAMNKLVEKLLKKWKVKNADGSWFNPDGEFYENRPVIVTQNSKELDLYNGDIGIVRKNNLKQYRVYFEGKDGIPRAFPVAFIGKCETVFAMTIHKSQGSEYDHVLVVLPTGKDNPLLTRELLYTAVTRAKKQVVVSATAPILLQTASASVSRVSGITDRIHELTN
jgi:exodeoxyribonuclease V alpha subunit